MDGKRSKKAAALQDQHAKQAESRASSQMPLPKFSWDCASGKVAEGIRRTPSERYGMLSTAMSMMKSVSASLNFQ
eukprot:2597348-Pyramimonas_sp.AAC.1